MVGNPFPVTDSYVSLPRDCAPGLGAEVDESALGEPVIESML